MYKTSFVLILFILIQFLTAQENKGIKIKFAKRKNLKNINNNPFSIDFLSTSFVDYDTAKINIRNIFGIQYYSFIYTGDKKKEFRVLFDSGSSWTWLPSYQCKTCQWMAIKHYFVCGFSKSCYLPKPLQSIRIYYGKGKLFGVLCYEDFSIKSNNKYFSNFLKNNIIAAIHHPFILALFISRMSRLSFDGIVGLSFPSRINHYLPTYLDSLYNQKKIKQKVLFF